VAFNASLETVSDSDVKCLLIAEYPVIGFTDYYSDAKNQNPFYSIRLILNDTLNQSCLVCTSALEVCFSTTHHGSKNNKIFTKKENN